MFTCGCISFTHFWKIILMICNSQLIIFFLSALKCIILLPSGLHTVYQEICWLSYQGCLAHDNSLFFCCFQDSSFVSCFWHFNYNAFKCGFRGLILHTVLRTSWICRHMLFLKFEKFLAIFSPNNLYAPSVSLLLRLSYVVHLIMSHKSLRVYSVFFSFCSSDSIISSDMCSNLLVLCNDCLSVV